MGTHSLTDSKDGGWIGETTHSSGSPVWQFGREYH